jgi:hypothetical protein
MKDFVAAEKFWSPNYIQHSAHIPPFPEWQWKQIATVFARYLPRSRRAGVLSKGNRSGDFPQPNNRARMKGAQRRADKCRVVFIVMVYRLSCKAFLSWVRRSNPAELSAPLRSVDTKSTSQTRAFAFRSRPEQHDPRDTATVRVINDPVKESSGRSERSTSATECKLLKELT